MLKPLLAIALLPLALPAFAGECEANFKKSGNPLVMTTYTSAVTVPNEGTGEAVAQTPGSLGGETMDVMADDPDGGGDADPIAQLDALAKAYSEKNSVSFAKGYDAVLATPEGSKLYAKSVGQVPAMADEE